MMSDREHYELRKPITPFICSTPLDFQEEREYLTRRVYPALNNHCRIRGTSFMPVDLQWRPDDSSMTDGRYLRLSLDLITQTAPFFLCLLGETYGPFRPKGTQPLNSSLPWTAVPIESSLDKNYIYAASAGYKWLLSDVHQNCSFTELEVFQAAFLRDSDHCLFYFRQPEHLDHKRKDVKDDSELDKYKPESVMHGLRIEDLKQRIVLKGHPVRYYQRVEDLVGMVLQDWIEIIDQMYPPMINQDNFLFTESYREWTYQEHFAESRRESYIQTDGGEEIVQAMSDFAVTAKDKIDNETHAWKTIDDCLINQLRNRKVAPVLYQSIMLVCGDRGVGKSTLMAQLQNRVKSWGVKVIFHYVGCSIRSKHIGVFLQNATQELREHFLQEEKPLPDKSSYRVDNIAFPDLVESFVAAAALGPCVIILDGIDELVATHDLSLQEVKEFKWLPFPLPQQCKFILTSCRSDMSFMSLSTRHDVRILRLRHLLTEKQAPEFLSEFLGPFYSLLTEEHLESIETHKLGQQPLFLNLLAAEIKCLNVYKNLDTWLNTIYEVTSMREVLVMTLQRWVTDYSWISDHHASTDQDDSLFFDFRGWLPDVLRLLIASRGGLSMQELMKCLYQLGYIGDLQVTMFHWWRFRCAIGPLLCTKPGGLLDISHQYLREILSYILFRQIKPGLSQLPAVKSETMLEMNRKLYHSCLYHRFVFQHLSQHCFEELPWQAMLSQNIQGLIRLLAEFKFLLENLDENGKYPSNRSDVLHYWQELVQLNYHIPQLLEEELVRAELLEPCPKSSTEIDEKVDIVAEGVQIVVEDQEFEVMGGYNQLASADKNPPVQIPILTSINPSVPDILTTVPSDRNISVYGGSDYESVTLNMSLSACKMDQDPWVPDCELPFEEPYYPVKPNKENQPFPREKIGTLMWLLTEFLWDVGQLDLSVRVLTGLINHLKKNAPLSLVDCQTQIRAYRRLGNICQQQGDLNKADKYYRVALAALVALENSFDDEDKPQLPREKGELINEIVENRLLRGVFDNAGELIVEALDAIKDCPAIHTLQASLLYNKAIVHFHNDQVLEAQECLSESLALREQWFGQMNILVADTLAALAQLLSQSNMPCFDKNRAETYYRRAIHIRSKILGADSIQVANLLIDLGKLISAEKRLMIQREATCIFKKAMDIKTAHLGPNHADVRAVRDLLTDIEVAIKLGQYYFGPGKILDNRRSSLPYSLLTYRDVDLERLNSKRRSQSARTSVEKASSTIRASTSPRPSSSMAARINFLPASEQVLLEPLVRTSLLKPKGLNVRVPSPPPLPAMHRPHALQDGPCYQSGSLKKKYDAKGGPEEHFYLTELSTQDESQTGSQYEELQRDEHHVDSFGAFLASPGKSAPAQTESEHPAAKVDRSPVPFHSYPRPSSSVSSTSRSTIPTLGRVMEDVPPIQTFELFQIVPHHTAPRAMVQSNTPRRRLQQQLIKGVFIPRMSKGEIPATLSTATNTCNHGHCEIPGPFDVDPSNYISIIGPYSDMESLLGNPPTPREPTGLLHHRSCWYHVPGRYPIPNREFPPKRCQKSPGVLAYMQAAESIRQGYLPNIPTASSKKMGDHPAENRPSAKDPNVFVKAL